MNKSLVFAENIFTIFNAQNHLQKFRCFLELPAGKMLSTAVNMAPEAIERMSVFRFSQQYFSEHKEQNI